MSNELELNNVKEPKLVEFRLVNLNELKNWVQAGESSTNSSLNLHLSNLIKTQFDSSSLIS